MSVSKDLANKTWTVQVWYKDYTGKRKHTTKRGFATKREAERWEHEFSLSEHSADITIGEMAKAYMKYLDEQQRLGNIRQNTVTLKKQLINKRPLDERQRSFVINI